MTDLPAMCFMVKKVAGRLEMRDFGDGGSGRCVSVFWCIQQADKVYNWPDFPEIPIIVGDYEHHAWNYTFSKQNHYNNLIPDFHFHQWLGAGFDDYTTFTHRIDEAGREPFEINKVGWIGSPCHANRRTLLRLGQENRELFDVFDSLNYRYYHRQDNPDPNSKCHCDKYISTPDLVKRYSMVIDVEGEGYSGRTKHLLWSHRPLLLVDRPHKEYFYEYLQEWVHYIPVKRDLSDVLEKTQWCLDNYDKAKEIAENAYQFAKIWLTREACYAQWNKIIMKHLEQCTNNPHHYH